MSDFLFDTSVLLDIVTNDVVWEPWSERQLRSALGVAAVFINPIIYAELAPAFSDVESLNRWLHPNLFVRASLPYAAGWIAAQAFLRYRQLGGSKATPLPDFYIGAHAEVEGLTLVTRDVARYRTYFPAVRLIAPDRTS